MIEIDSTTPTRLTQRWPGHSVDRVVVLVRAGLVAVFLPDAGARHEALGHLLVLPSNKRTQTSRHGSVSHLPLAHTPVLSLLGPARPAAPHHLPPTTRARYIMRPACWRPLHRRRSRAQCALRGQALANEEAHKERAGSSAPRPPCSTARACATHAVLLSTQGTRGYAHTPWRRRRAWPRRRRLQQPLRARSSCRASPSGAQYTGADPRTARNATKPKLSVAGERLGIALHGVTQRYTRDTLNVCLCRAHHG